MATTTAGEQLTEAQRRTSLAIRAVTLRELLLLWPIFSLDDIDGSWQRLAPALLALIQSRHDLDAQRAAAYYEAFRLAEGASGSPTTRLAPFDRRRAEANLALVGPIWTKRSIVAGTPNPLNTALVRVSGEVARLVMNGSRRTLVDSVAADRQALGFRRISDGNPCYFCAMLVGRGGVYTEASVGFQAHSNCGCTGQPVYSTADQPRARARELSQLWNESTRGHSGDDAIRAFRQAYEGR